MLAAQPKVIVIMPAYNAAKTLEKTYHDIPPGIVDKVILVDDVSQDETVEIARRLGLKTVIHIQNRAMTVSILVNTISGERKPL